MTKTRAVICSSRSDKLWAKTYKFDGVLELALRLFLHVY